MADKPVPMDPLTPRVPGRSPGPPARHRLCGGVVGLASGTQGPIKRASDPDVRFYAHRGLRSDIVRTMSGLPLIATELRTSPEVRFVPEGDSCTAANELSVDDPY
jgi:hypothetical protein